MKINRISQGEMPPAGKYILVYAEHRPWCDSTDKAGVFWKVAKCVYGITLEQRETMRNSNNIADKERANRYRPEDEGCGNNMKPYRFIEFGPDSHFGQDIDIWCELPRSEVRSDYDG